MKKNRFKTVDQVIKMGWIYITAPTFLLLNGIPLILLFLSGNGFLENYNLIHIISFYSLGLILSLLWYKNATVQWKLWAFKNSNPEDWKTIKERAIKSELISDKENAFLQEGFRDKLSLAKFNAIEVRIEKQSQKLDQ